MREEGCNWRLQRWEEELPSPEELTPLSQTLITPDLAVAFGIQPHHHRSSPAAHQAPLPSHQPGSADFDSSSEMGGGGGGSSGGDESARTLKRPRLVWTPQLHKRFVDAVAHLGIKNAVPKTIMQLMSVDGLTRENVASHLQKYRLYLKRMQGLNCAGAGDPATDRLFASSPVPPHFLHPQGGGRPGSEYYMGYAPPAPVVQVPSPAAMVVGGQYHHRQMGTFGSPTNGAFEHPFLARQAQMGVRLGGAGAAVQNSVGGFHAEDVVDSGTASHGRRVLTLFPTGND